MLLRTALVASSALFSPALASSYLPTAVKVQGAFPTSVFATYYVQPDPTTEPQPVIYDPVLNITFPFNVTNPKAIPTHGTDPGVFPSPAANLTQESAQDVVNNAISRVLSIIGSSGTASSNCSRCLAALSVAQTAAKLAPKRIPEALVLLCQLTGYKSPSMCRDTYDATSFGAPWTQILTKADVGGLDGQHICAYLSRHFCRQPGVVSSKAVFPKPRPLHPKSPARSGKRVKVLHLSDLHLDTRYAVGAEANCTFWMCCRLPPLGAQQSPQTIINPAPLYGYYQCDSPFYLAVAALQSIGPLTGTSADNPPAMTLYTGDLVAHDPQNQMSRAYLEATEDAVWQLFKSYIGGPIYSALGNHDTSPDNMDAPHAIDSNGALGQQFSWNYNHVSSLWQHYSWINTTTAHDASTHYAAYAVTPPAHPNLRIITLNTDFYHANNPFAFLHASDPDFSGMFTFLIAQLQLAEDTSQRAWIIGHVPSGWDGTDPLPHGSDLLYQIIERYSPHVVANVFFGHTHEDQAFIYYRHNGTRQTAAHAIASAWVGPSLTPLTNLNAGYRMYEVDTNSWDVWDAYTYHADVGTFAALAGGEGPVFRREYSTREAYGAAAGWADGDPLNATFWHRVTEAMERDRGLVAVVNGFQGKSSGRTPNCTSDTCARAKVCYMRSGSAALGRRCPQGFGSVQGEYDGVEEEGGGAGGPPGAPTPSPSPSSFGAGGRRGLDIALAGISVGAILAVVL